MPRRRKGQKKKRKEESGRLVEKRQNREYRDEERERDCQARSLSREHNAKESNKKGSRKSKSNPTLDQSSGRKKNKNPRRKRKEEAERLVVKRGKADYKSREKQRDLESRTTARRQEQVRNEERKRDRSARRSARRNESYRQMESHRVALRRRGSNNEHRKEYEREAKRCRRMELTAHVREKEANTKARRHSRQKEKSNYDKNLLLYFKKIRMSPTSICSCCGQLWYPGSMTVVDHEGLKCRGLRADVISKVLFVCQSVHHLCGTCKRSIYKGNIPKMALSNGFDFPEIVEELQGLTPLEERLVALRLPFMQIRGLGTGKQIFLKGNVVNVENDLDVCAKVLPRKFDDSSTVQVKLMRRMGDRNPYMYETIRPLKVYNAAKYLVNTELYKSEQVQLSCDWERYEEDSTLNFDVDGPSSLNQEEYLMNEANSPYQIEDALVQNEDVNPLDEDETRHYTYTQDNMGGLLSSESLIFNERRNSLLGIKIAPGEGKRPIGLFGDTRAEEMSFPCIYGGIIRTFTKGIRISYTDIAKSELRRMDRRACCPTKILYAFRKSFNEKLSSCITICLRKRVGNENVTASEARNEEFLENLMQKDNGYAIFKNLRSSPSFWQEKTKKVLAMIRQMGKCTFFITLSAAETRWKELLVMLMKIVKGKDITEDEAEQLSFQEVGELIRSDPVTCIRHFDHRYRALLNMLIKPEYGVFTKDYQLKDYFSRVEFQMRGSPHSHGLYWLAESPTFIRDDEDSAKTCAEFIDKFITTERCEDEDMVQLIGYQLHKHSSTCTKKNRLGTKCRFGFPKPPLDETKILLPLPNSLPDKDIRQSRKTWKIIEQDLTEKGRSYKTDLDFERFLDSLGLSYSQYISAIRSTISRPTVFLKRSTNAIYINPYNKKILQAWKANMDIQFVIDAYACAKYCVGYITKSEAGMSKLIQATSSDIRNGNYSAKDKLKQFSSNLIRGSEISAQEASSFLLGLPATSCSRQDVYINTSHPKERVRILKPLEQLQGLTEDSENIFAKGLLDYYVNRPEEVEDMCLADFASLYNYSRSKKGRNPDYNDEATENASDQEQMEIPPSDSNECSDSESSDTSDECTPTSSETDSNTTDYPEYDGNHFDSDTRDSTSNLATIQELSDSQYEEDDDYIKDDDFQDILLRGEEEPCDDLVGGKWDNIIAFELRDRMGFMTRRRGNQKVIRFRHYGESLDSKNYWREQMMLFVPWRDEEEDLLNVDAQQEAKQRRLTIVNNSRPYYATRLVDEVLLQQMLDERYVDSTDDEDEMIEYSDDDANDETIREIFQERRNKKGRIDQFLPPKLIPEETYKEIMTGLNEKQRRIVLEVLHRFKIDSDPFHIFLSGGAGVGKSHAITAIVQSFLRYDAKFPNQNPEQLCILVAAPTGKAAFNVFGMTLHCMFRLPPNQNKTKLCPLDEASVNSLRVRLSRVRLFIIDEISMVSVRQIYDIDDRLRQIYATEQEFGGRSILAVGHLRQLKPIAGKYVFLSPDHLNMGILAGNCLWERFSFFELDEIMRQKDDANFCKALNNMAEGQMDEADIALIRSRQINEVNQPPAESIHLFRTNAECEDHNKLIHFKLMQLNTDGATSIATDRIQGRGTAAAKMELLNYAKQLTRMQSDGLPYETRLQVGGLYFVTTNVDVSDGLFNGATCTLRAIEYTGQGNDIKPKIAWVKFENDLIGATKRSSVRHHPNINGVDCQCVPIGKITRNLTKKGRKDNLEVVRTQIPLTPANGMTIAKSQGSSMSYVVLRTWKNDKRGNTQKVKFSREEIYVACSRATSSNGLFIDGEFDPPSKPKPDDPVTREMQRLQTSGLKFKLQFLQDFGDSFVKFYFHNIEYFIPHHQDLRRDKCANSADILAFVEPHVLNTDNLNFYDYNCIHQTYSISRRSSTGVLLLSKNTTMPNINVVRMLNDSSGDDHWLLLHFHVDSVSVVVGYKSPNFSKSIFLNQLQLLLQNVQNKAIIVGDFNIDLKKPEGKALKDVFETGGFQSMLNLEHPSNNYGTHIDCCFSNFEIPAWFYETSYSYHNPICVVWPKS